ncbi:MAG: hypothetical protein LBV23_09290 [Deltaproteobacteria bacterium]|jgi:flavodoxin|nr:hypothetical protein [Deltaproteobacteria bacterium]
MFQKIKLLSLSLATALLLSFLFSAIIEAQGNSKQALNDEKSLIILFSQTGKTAGIAKLIVDKTGAETFLIESTQTYPADEREIIAIEEKRLKEARSLTLKNQPPDLTPYSIIYLGSPVWFGEPPEIVKIFLAKTDFKNKPVAIFATSGTQPNDINAQLAALVKNGKVLEPTLLHKRADEQDPEAIKNKVAIWLDALKRARF